MRRSGSMFVGLAFAAVAGCTNHSASGAVDARDVQDYARVTAWARAMDSLAQTSKPFEFDFPSQSTEGGGGRLYRFADSSVRIDIDHFGETGRVRERFFARGVELRLAVEWEERYDRPSSGRVIRSIVDSTWFHGDSVARWIDSLGVARRPPDSLLQARAREVRAEYLWSIHNAGTMPTGRGPLSKPYKER